MKGLLSKKKFISTIILSVLVISILTPFHTVKAGLPVTIDGPLPVPVTTVTDVPRTIQAKIENPREFFRMAKDILTSISSISSSISDFLTSKATSALVIKEYVLDPLANILAKAIIRAVTNTIVSWIQGGGKPMFVQDLGKEIVKAADETGGEFLNRLAGTNLCSGFNIDFKFNLTLPRITKISQCTVSGIISAIKNTTFNKEIGIFYNDFAVNGAARGIETYLSLLDPANSFTNSFDKAYYTKASLEIQAGQKRIKIFDWGGGFKPFEWNETVDDPDSCKQGEDGRIVCQKVKTGRTMTPGKVVAETLQKSIDIGLDVGAIADELDEAIITIINALINRIVNGSIPGSTGGGLAGEGPGNIPFEEPRVTVNVLDQKVDDITMRITATQLILYKELIILNSLSEEINEKITKLNEEKTKLTKEKQDCEINPSTCSPERLKQIEERLKQIDEEIKQLETQKTNKEKEKREGRLPTPENNDVIPGPIPILEKLNGLLDRALNLKNRSMDNTDAGEIADLNKKASALEQELGEAIFNVRDAPGSGQAGTKTEDNWIEVINKVSERAELVIVQIDKKLKNPGTSQEEKQKLTITKTEIQKLINDLKGTKTKITSAGTDFGEIKKLILESIPKIKELNKRVFESQNL